MSYESVPFRGFGGGLNLRDKDDAVDETECIDCLNVEYTTAGAVKQRAGYAKFTTSALTSRAASLEPYYTSTGTKQILAGCGTRLEAISTAGAVVASATGLTTGTWDFARFGAPTNQVAYAGNGSNVLQRWNGATWAAVANTPQAGSLGVMAVDQGNRLVAGAFSTTTGGPTGAANTSNPSRVYFSAAGDPETWATNDYVDFSPGDGEAVVSVTAWREFVFVFKETKFFVLYGTSTDAAGNPVFNYRTIDGGCGVASSRAVAVLPDGVYFMSRRGVYRTTGSEAELISSPVDPIFLGSPSPFYNGGVLNHAQVGLCAMGAHEQRIYLAFPSGTSTANDRVLVYDTVGEWWSLYDFPASSLASFRISDQAELVFGYSSGTNDLARHSSSYTTDAAGGTNLVTNNSFETDTTGWNATAAATISRVTTEHAVGSASLQVVLASDGQAYSDNIASSADTAYTFSAQVKAPLGMHCFLSIYAGVFATTAFTGTGNWKTVSVSLTSTHTSTFAQVGVEGTTAGTLYLDDVKLTSASAVVSHWQSGWFDYDLTAEKTIRETKLWGSGAVFLSVAKDFALETGTQDLLTFSTTNDVTWNTSNWNTSLWGGAPAGLTEKLRRRAIRGTTFSTRFDNATVSQTWAVHRLAHHLREQRVPSISN